MEILDTKVKIGDIVLCKKGQLGLVTKVEDGISTGISLSRLRFGKKWQSIDPKIVGNILDYIKILEDK